MRVFLQVGCVAGALALSALQAMSVLAAEPTHPGLADGLGMISAYTGLDPKAREAAQQLTARAPEHVRRQVGKSDWSSRHTIKTPTQLDDAAVTPDQVLLPGPAGLVAVKRDDLRRSIEGLTDFAIDQKETLEFLRSSVGKIKDPTKRAIVEKVINQLGQLRNPGPSSDRGFVERTIRQGIQIVVWREVDEAATKLTEEIRSEVLASDPKKVLDKYREKAKDLARRARGGKSGNPAGSSPGSPPSGSTPPAAEVTPKPDFPLETIRSALNELKTKVAAADAKVKTCNAGATGIPSSLANAHSIKNWVRSPSLKTTFAENANRRAQNAQRAISSLERFVAQAGQTARQACVNPSSAQQQALDRDRLVARGTYEAARDELNNISSSLAKPLDASSMKSTLAQLKPGMNFCQTYSDLASKAGLSGPGVTGLLDRQVIEALAQSIEKQLNAATNAGASASEASSLRAQLQSLQTQARDLTARYSDCETRVRNAVTDCQDLQTIDGQLKSLIKRAEVAEKERSETLAKVVAQQRKLEAEYGKLRRSAARAEVCLSEGDNRQDGCDPKAIASAYAEANAAYGKQSYATARRKIYEILARYGGCPGVSDKVERDEGLIDTMVGGNVNVGTSIDTCNVPRMRNQIAILESRISKIEQGRTRRLPRTRLILLRWIDRLNGAIDKCDLKTASANTGGSATVDPPGRGSTSGSTSGVPADGSTGAAPGAAGGTQSGGQQCDTVVFAYAKTVVPKVVSPKCEAPCPSSLGWVIPPEARCRSGGQAAPGNSAAGPTLAPSTTASKPQASSPVSSKPPPASNVVSSGCGPYPNCGGEKRCKPVQYVCRNGEWMGGHCICDKSVFKGRQ